MGGKKKHLFKIIMVSSLVKHKIIKKRTKKFIRFQSDCKAGSIKPNWRRPKGIDSAVRRKFKGRTLMPNIGYGTREKHRNILPDGFMKFVVRNVKELDILTTQNRTFAAEIAQNVSFRKRKEILARACLLDVKVLNKFPTK